MPFFPVAFGHSPATNMIPPPTVRQIQTPIDNVDPFVTFGDALNYFQLNDPQKSQVLTSSSSPEVRLLSCPVCFLGQRQSFDPDDLMASPVLTLQVVAAVQMVVQFAEVKRAELSQASEKAAAGK